VKPDDDFEVTLLLYYRPNAETTPYVSPRPLADVEQRWFCGAHGDVGGGTYSDALAQLPLRYCRAADCRSFDSRLVRTLPVKASPCRRLRNSISVRLCAVTLKGRGRLEHF
jgi:hypothetical protein